MSQRLKSAFQALRLMLQQLMPQRQQQQLLLKPHLQLQRRLSNKILSSSNIAVQ